MGKPGTQARKSRWWVRLLKRLMVGLVAFLVLAVLVGAGFEYAVRRNAEVTYPPPGEMVDIGGRRMHLDCRGNGSPTVLLESGLDTNGSLSWDKVHDALAAVTRTCAYDRAGVMWSEPKEGPQDAEGVTADLHATLAAAGESGPLVMVGHSLGGPYIMNYTKQYGDDVKGLVFVDCSHPDQMERLPPAIVRQVEVATLYKVIDALSWTGVLQLLPDAPLPGMPERIKLIGKAHVGTSFGASMKEMMSVPVILKQGGELRDLGDRPLVVLVAMQPIPEDQLTAMGLTRQDGEAMQAVWRELTADEATWSTRSRLQLVPDSLHYIQFQRPDLVIEAVTEVVNTVRAESAGR